MSSEMGRLPTLRFKDLLVLLTPFLSGVYWGSPFGNVYFFYALMVFYILLFLLKERTLYLSKGLFFFLFAGVLISVIFNWMHSVSAKFIISYIPPVFLSVLCYYLYLRENFFDAEIVYRKYVVVASFFSIFAVAQELFFLLGSDHLLFFANIIKREGPFVGVVGLSSEPSNFAVVMMPAVYYAIKNLSSDRVRSFLILLSVVFSFSSLGYIGIFLSAALVFFQMAKRSMVLIVALSPLMLWVGDALLSQEYMERRVDDTLGVITDKKSLSPHEVNLSTYTLLVNYEIVTKGVRDNYMAGVGAGAYEVMFDKYIGGYSVPEYRDQLPGRSTAASFLLKISAEFGLLGFLVSMFFIIKNSSPAGVSDANKAFMIAVVLIYIRMGMYYVNGVPLMLMMLYYSKKRRCA